MGRTRVLFRAAALAGAAMMILSIPLVAAAVTPSALGGTPSEASVHPAATAPPVPGPVPQPVVHSFKVERFCPGQCPPGSVAGSLVAFTVTARSTIVLQGTPWKAYTGTVQFTSSDPKAVLPPNYTFTGVGGDDGVRLVTVTFKTAGPQTLKVTSTTTSMTGKSDPIAIGPAAAHHTAFATQPGGAMTGSPLSTQPAVRILDAYENQTASTAAITLSLVPPPGSAGAALTCESGTTLAAVAGTATFLGCAVSLAGTDYTMVGTSPGLLSGTSAPFTITAGPTPTPTATATPSPTPTPTPTPGPVGTLLLTAYSPYMNNNAIDWGKYVDLTTTAPAGTAFHIQVTTDNSTWTTLADANATPLTFTVGASGAYTYRYTPIRNYWYRSVSGSTMTDGALRVTVRQTATIRPIHSGTRSVSSGTTVTFSVQVRPARPELQKANVLFQLYRNSGGSWILSRSATVVIDDAGMAVYPFTFTTGKWFVRAQAQPTPVNANSFWTPRQLYTAS